MSQQPLHGWDEVAGSSNNFVDDALFFQQAGAPFITKLTSGGMRPGQRVSGRSCFFDGKMFDRRR